MALTNNTQILWSDIKNIYTNINTTRTNFKKTALPIPEKTGSMAAAADMNTLNSFIAEMQNYTTTFGARPLTGMTGTTIDPAGSIMRPD